MPSLALQQPPEEGFVSGSSAEDSSPSFVERLAYEMSTLGLISDGQGLSMTFAPKCSSDSGASTGDSHTDLHHAMHQLNHDSSERLLPVQRPTQQLPGAWFYEMGNESTGLTGSPPSDIDMDGFAFGVRSAALSSRNVTESVEVPSSEHVAEIVGRQGCKIKALRAKTNTYIKTPVRGEEPVFVVTGRAEDVADAKREIECAAEHFTQIRASRRHSQGGVPAPGHITAYVRVPLRVVGLVVGPKGATIKRIQQDTHTYIITPSREREPIFEVTGLPQNVEAARREIEQHIYQRTGNMPITDPSASLGAFDLQSNIAAARTASYGALAHSTPVRRASAIDSTASQYVDFHRNGNDVSYTGGAPLIRNSAISKPYSAGGSPPPSSQQTNGISSSGFLSQFELASALRNNQSAFNNSSLLGGSSAYPAWSMGGYGSGQSSALADSNGHQHQQLSQHELFTQMRPSLGSYLSTLHGCGGALNDMGSMTRDEGLGDSPAASFGALNGGSSTAPDPYHLMMSSIWSDLDNPRDQPTNFASSEIPINA